MNIKSLVLGSASLVALFAASNASAADLPRHVKAPVAVMVRSHPVAFSWDGAYAGAELGGRFTSFSEKVNDVKITSAVMKKQYGEPNGLIGGVFAGFNANIGNNVILGVDGNVDLGNMHKQINANADTNPGGWKFKEKLSGAARLRVGYAMDRFMPYIAGGLSVASIEAVQGVGTATEGYLVNGVIASVANKITKFKNHTAMGWNIGGGVDYALTDNLILRADYRHTKIAKFDINTPVLNPTAGADQGKVMGMTANSVERAINSNDIRVGIAYKF